jgi:hypothetical protein
MKAKLANFRMAIAAAKGPNVGAKSIFHYCGLKAVHMAK